MGFQVFGNLSNITHSLLGEVDIDTLTQAIQEPGKHHLHHGVDSVIPFSPENEIGKMLKQHCYNIMQNGVNYGQPVWNLSKQSDILIKALGVRGGAGRRGIANGLAYFVFLVSIYLDVKPNKSFSISSEWTNFRPRFCPGLSWIIPRGKGKFRTFAWMFKNMLVWFATTIHVSRYLLENMSRSPGRFISSSISWKASHKNSRISLELTWDIFFRVPGRWGGGLENKVPKVFEHPFRFSWYFLDFAFSLHGLGKRAHIKYPGIPLHLNFQFWACGKQAQDQESRDFQIPDTVFQDSVWIFEHPFCCP